MGILKQTVPLESLSKHRLQEIIAGYVMVLPAALVLGVFVILPILGTLLLLFTRYDGLTPPVWDGLRNLRQLATDVRLAPIYRNTLLITLGAVVGNNVLGLLLAMGLNRPIHRALLYLLRTGTFFPVLTTTSSMALIWTFLLANNRGVLNWVLGQIGLEPVPWLTSSSGAIISIIIYDIWKNVGTAMIVYLAGLQGISREYYEAAKLDGANTWQLARHITLPLLTPSIFFSVTLGLIAGFQIFDAAYVLTGGGPGDGSRTIAIYIYEVAFSRFEFGYGSAVALTLLIILVLLTLVQFWLSRKWVFYG